jgi:hypothetical protein
MEGRRATDGPCNKQVLVIAVEWSNKSELFTDSHSSFVSSEPVTSDLNCGRSVKENEAIVVSDSLTST